MLREFVLHKRVENVLNVENSIVAESCQYRLMPRLAIACNYRPFHFLSHLNLLYELIIHTFTLLMQRMSIEGPGWRAYQCAFLRL